MNPSHIIEVQVWKTREQFNEQQSYSTQDSGYCHVGYLGLKFTSYKSLRSWSRSRKRRLDNGVRLVPRKYAGEALDIGRPFIINANILSSEVRGEVNVDESRVSTPSQHWYTEARSVSFMLEYQACILGEVQTKWYHLGYGPDIIDKPSNIPLAIRQAEKGIKTAYEEAIAHRGGVWSEGRWQQVRATYRYIPRQYDYELRGVTSFNSHKLLHPTLSPDYVNTNIRFLLCGE